MKMGASKGFSHWHATTSEEIRGDTLVFESLVLTNLAPAPGF
jgi:hypothetical protein